MALAQAVLGTPIVVALSHRMMVDVWATYGDALLVDGASRSRAMISIMSIGREGLLTAFLAAFGRAIAEVGAILIVGGNIRGYTRTMTTAIALETSKGDFRFGFRSGQVYHRRLDDIDAGLWTVRLLAADRQAKDRH
jgi:tungstate transport system permease protein